MSLRPKVASAVLIGLLVLTGRAEQGFANPAPPVAPQALGSTTVADLVKTLKITDVIDVMRLEGLSYGAEMETELLQGHGGAAWSSVVEMIYDRPTLQARFADAFAQQLATRQQDLPAIQQFFGTELGQRILTLEIEARRSLMDAATEDAAKARVEDMMAKATPRFAALEDFSNTNDLIEMNVSGTLNSNLAFFQGLAEVGALGQDMTQDDVLAEVWGQEPDIRAETEAWVYPYLALAYDPLSDQELASYIAFSKTGPGQVLNTALFAAFDSVFNTISHNLGLAVAKQMMGEDI
jgi:hypothetical protein